MPVQPDPVSTKRVEVLKALAHPSRLLITEALMTGELCVGEITDLVGDDVSTVSKHLSILRAAGILSSKKRGLNVHYRVSCGCFGDFLSCIDQICEPGPSRRVEENPCC